MDASNKMRQRSAVRKFDLNARSVLHLFQIEIEKYIERCVPGLIFCYERFSMMNSFENLYEAMSTFPVVHRFRIVHRCCGVLF